MSAKIYLTMAAGAGWFDWCSRMESRDRYHWLYMVPSHDPEVTWRSGITSHLYRWRHSSSQWCIQHPKRFKAHGWGTCTKRWALFLWSIFRYRRINFLKSLPSFLSDIFLQIICPFSKVSNKPLCTDIRSLCNFRCWWCPVVDRKQSDVRDFLRCAWILQSLRQLPTSTVDPGSGIPGQTWVQQTEEGHQWKSVSKVNRSGSEWLQGTFS